MDEEMDSVRHCLIELERKGDVLKVLGYESESASAPGDNYVSNVLRLKVKVELNSGEVEERHFVCKCVSENEKIRAMFSTVFRMEVKVLTEILPEMTRIIQQVSPDEERFYPKCFAYLENKSILIEDLKPLGYTHAGYRKGLDFDHCCLIMKALGKVHALGAILLERGQINPKDHYLHKFEKDFEEFISIFKDLTNDYVTQAEEVWKGEWEQYGVRLRKACEQLYKLKDIFARNDSRFNTFLHGDCWITNTMFRYDVDGNVASVRLLDWQLCWYNTGGFDVNYFLWSSAHTDARPRKAELIRTYHDSLSRSLRLYGYIKEPPTLDDTVADCERTSLFGFATSLPFLQFMMKPPSEKITGENGKTTVSVLWDHEETKLFKTTIQYIIKEAAEMGLI